ncbi:histone deacetylase family protein [Longitalea luteola]|uniref:histone deacetylase family protein n=1 Tax=Longitalea luteola TaxID=2812563 RepID=UPI001A95C295|nr:histone deacetylase [Longitalea luteola]
MSATPPVLKIAFDPVYAHPLPEGHRFPMLKYELIPEQLLYEGTIAEHNLFAPTPCPDEVVMWTHDPVYVQKLHQQTLSAREQRHIGFPQSPQLTRREFVITQGTIDCCHYAFEHGVALNVAGGTHHAFADRGEGFCLLNDFAVAANYLLKKALADKILIIDLDVHQGNGTARLFEHERRVFTFSMHGAHNYPFHKEKSDLDIALNDGTEDGLYLSLLRTNLLTLLDQLQPDFAFYLSGVDILATDKFGKLKISMEGCRQRDELVFTTLKQRRIPCVVAMGGGYSPDIKTIVEAHCNTFRVAKDIYTP